MLCVILIWSFILLPPKNIGAANDAAQYSVAYIGGV